MITETSRLAYEKFKESNRENTIRYYVMEALSILPKPTSREVEHHLKAKKGYGDKAVQPRMSDLKKEGVRPVVFLNCVDKRLSVVLTGLLGMFLVLLLLLVILVLLIVRLILLVQLQLLIVILWVCF